MLRLTRLTETSLIVHWLSGSEGLVRTVAKGARRPKSPFLGKLDLFFGAEIGISRARSGDLHLLREVVVAQWREGIRRDYVTTLMAGYFCQLMERGLEPEHPEPEFFDLLKRALDHLEVTPPSIRAVTHFEREFARLLGIMNQQSTPENSLRDALGSLPTTRKELIERLSSPIDFDSSDTGNGR